MSVPPEFGEDFHAKLSPSSAHRWIPCPGSVHAIAEVVDPSVDDSNEHSRLGTAVHALIEACLCLGVQPERFMGVQLVNDSHPAVDEEQCDGARVLLDYVQEYIDTHGFENLIVLPERRLLIGASIDITGNPEHDNTICNGTADVTIAHVDLSMCVTVDYKNGKNGVEVRKNPQLMLYALGARQRYGRFKRHKSVIVQPRAGKKNPVEEWEYPASTLDKFVREVQPSARAAISVGAPRTAGDHCRYCQAAPKCRTYRDRVWSSAAVEFPRLSQDEDPEHAAQRLTDDEIQEILNDISLVRRYLDTVEQYAARRLVSDPRAFSQWRLAWGRRIRKWDDIEGLTDYLERIGVPRGEYAPNTMLSPAEMEKLLRRYVRQPRQRRSKSQPAPRPDTSPVEAFVTYTVPRQILVPVSAADEFDPIDQQHDADVE